jgi:alanyl-tRNA synthetase
MQPEKQRLYFNDPYLTHFEASITARDTLNGQPAVCLSQTAFYPTGGGQPHDTGHLNSVSVLDVISEDKDDIWHVLEQPITDEQVQGEIDWQRRFDHMVHHTGQHILTRAFINVLGAETVGFHIGSSGITLDLNKTDMRPADIDAAEDLANQVIAENRAVRAWFPIEDDLAALNLRKVSDKVTGQVRVVDIGGFDATACGGTHVAHTGEIGMIKIVRMDKRGDTTRVEFLCGQRALADYREKTDILNGLAAQLTTGYAQIPDVLEKMREENKALSKALKTARQELTGYESEALWQQARQSTLAGRRIIVKEAFEDRSPDELQQIANHMVEHPQTVALLGTAGEKAHFVFARSEDLKTDMVPLLKQALEKLGAGRGGGRPELAQGGGMAANLAEVQNALSTAMELVGE